MIGGECMKNNIVLIIVGALIIGAGSFYGGMQYQKSQRSVGFVRQSNGAMPGIGGQRSGQTGANRPVNGDIISNDEKSITVKLQDGSSKIILVTSTTSINKAAAATIADLKVGEKVAVFGQTNADGSMTAQNVQLNPINRNNPTNGNMNNPK
jgi:hypothetical protein